MLPEEDVEYLKSKSIAYELLRNDLGNGAFETLIIFPDFPLPATYEPRLVKLLIRLPANYPEANPDMFFTVPIVRLVATSGDPLNCGGRVPIHQETWQQWSRHFDPAAWRPMIDGLETYLAAVHKEIQRGI